MSNAVGTRAGQGVGQGMVEQFHTPPHSAQFHPNPQPLRQWNPPGNPQAFGGAVNIGNAWFYVLLQSNLTQAQILYALTSHGYQLGYLPLTWYGGTTYGIVLSPPGAQRPVPGITFSSFQPVPGPWGNAQGVTATSGTSGGLLQVEPGPWTGPYPQRQQRAPTGVGDCCGSCSRGGPCEGCGSEKDFGGSAMLGQTPAPAATTPTPWGTLLTVGLLSLAAGAGIAYVVTDRSRHRR